MVRWNASTKGLCCVALSVACTGAWAQSRFDALPSLSLSLGRSASEPAPALVKSDVLEAGAEARSRALPPLTLRLARTNVGIPLLMQMPQEEIPGQYVRPKYGLGFRSETMRQWAKGLGLDAHTCFAPIMRGRTRFHDGGLNGSLTLQARCSFN